MLCTWQRAVVWGVCGSWYFYAAAHGSVLSGEQNRHRCLDPGYKPILPDISLLPVILEENNWGSQILVTQVAAIIISEHLGHSVSFNTASDSKRVFERTSMMSGDATATWEEGDGPTLKEALDEGRPHAYANLEVWLQGKEASRKRTVEVESSVKAAGNLGFTGRDGWYVPRWMVDEYGVLAYTSWLPARDESLQSLFAQSRQSRSCMNATENTCSFQDAKVDATSNCRLWCKEEGLKQPQMLLQSPQAYSHNEINKDIIINNGMNIALKLSSPNDQLKLVKNMLFRNDDILASNGSKTPAVIFHHWEPTSDFRPEELQQLERIFLPGRDCGVQSKEGIPGTWRCDFEPNRLIKIRSAGMAKRAPVLEEFFRAFSIDIDDIKHLLGVFSEKVNPDKIMHGNHDAVFDTACTWVKANHDKWSTWTRDRGIPVAIPAFAQVWFPDAFFATFGCILFGSIFWCLCVDSFMVSDRADRSGSGYKKDFVPKLPPDRKSKTVVKPVDEPFVKKDRPGSVSEDATVFWISSVFYDRTCDKIVDNDHIDVGLVRVGKCNDQASVRIESISGSAVANVRYKPIDSVVTFEKDEAVKWFKVYRIQSIDWNSVQIFSLRISGVVSGSVSIGTLSQCSVVLTDLRKYPGLKGEALPLHTIWGQVHFVIALLREFIFKHTPRTETIRVLFVTYEAIYSTIVKNWLFSFWLLDECIGNQNYYGFLLIVCVEAFHSTMIRLSNEWQWNAGTFGLRNEIHQHAARKLTMPFCQDFDPEFDNHWMNIHAYSVDKGVVKIYSSCYNVYGSVLQLLLAFVYILATGESGSEDSHPFLSIYRFAPLVVMVPVSAYFGYFWHKEWHFKAGLDVEVQQQERIDRALWIVGARKTMQSFGLGYLTTQYEEEFSEALNNACTAIGLVGMHHMDSSWLSGYFADYVILASYVCLAMLHMESARFGIGNFTLGMFFSTIGVYQIMRGAVCRLCTNSRNIEGGITKMISVSELLDREAKIVQLSRSVHEQLKWLNLHQGIHQLKVKGLHLPGNPDVLQCEFRRAVATSGLKTLTFNGQMPLGKFYILQTNSSKDEIDLFFHLLQRMHQPEDGHLLLPPFVRCVGLYGAKLPELFHVSAIDNALAFADTSVYGEKEARRILEAFDVFGQSTHSHEFSEDQKLDGDPLTGKLDPPTVSVEDHALITLSQAILADPEMLVYDRPLMNLSERLHKRVIHAMVAWQRDGPKAVLDVCKRLEEETTGTKALQRGGTNAFAEANEAYISKAALQPKKIGEYPAWFQPDTGSLRRTLVINPQRQLEVEEMLNQYKDIVIPLYLKDGNVSDKPFSDDQDPGHPTAEILDQQVAALPSPEAAYALNQSQAATLPTGATRTPGNPQHNHVPGHPVAAPDPHSFSSVTPDPENAQDLS